jgi:DNA-directed RNA polymerase subunit RPC12/RpoP
MAENITGDMITEAGRTVKFGRDTGIKCPACGKGEEPNTLKVRSLIDNTAEIECPSCGYSECVPAEQVSEIRDIKGRLVTPPRR